jgi:hypothetical protein
MLKPFAYNCPGLSDPESRLTIGRLTFGDFFKSRDRIVVPIFQRRYCWDKSRVAGWWVHSMNPGVDVMITIFCDFRQFSAKKIGVFLKNQCYDQFFSKFSFVLSQKRQYFC